MFPEHMTLDKSLHLNESLPSLKKKGLDKASDSSGLVLRKPPIIQQRAFKYYIALYVLSSPPD